MKKKKFILLREGQGKYLLMWVSLINLQGKSKLMMFLSTSKKMKQQNGNYVIFKKILLEVHQYLARWVYEAGIPFNVIEIDSFKIFVEALGQYGPGYTPYQYQLREPLLKGDVERTKEILKKQEEK